MNRNASVIDSGIYSEIFSTEAMRAIWSDAARIQRYLDVEAALAKTQGKRSRGTATVETGGLLVQAAAWLYPASPLNLVGQPTRTSVSSGSESANSYMPHGLFSGLRMTRSASAAASSSTFST